MGTKDDRLEKKETSNLHKRRYKISHLCPPYGGEWPSQKTKRKRGEVKEITGDKVKVVEKAGMKIEDILRDGFKKEK